MAFLLMQKICILFLMMAGGYVIVRAGLIKAQDSRALSIVAIYLVQPCVIIKAFQIEFTSQVRQGFLLSVGAAILIHVILLLANTLFTRLFRLDPIEQASVIYPNSGNLVIPLVISVLGEEWVIYASAYMCVQLCFMWTHGLSLIQGSRGFQLKKILLNCNLIAIAAGMVFLITGIRLPGLFREGLDQMSALIGPVNMIMIGMLFASVNIREVAGSPRIWLICFLRMIAAPAIVLVVLWLLRLQNLAGDGRTLIYISYMAVIAPVASTVTQIAQLHRRRPEYAGAINVLTTLICIVTMPLMTGLFEFLF